MYEFGAVLLGLLLFVPGWHVATPFKVWCAAWCASWAVHAVLAPVYYSSAETLVFVLLGNIAFVVGCIAYRGASGGGQISATSNRAAVAEYLEGEEARARALLILLGLSVVSLEYGLSQVGGVAGLLTGGSSFFEVIRQGQASMYDGDEFAAPAGIKLATLFVCASSVIAGLKYGAPPHLRGVGWKVAAFYGLLLFALSAGSGVRSYILVGLLLFLFSYLSARVFISGGKNVVSIRFVVACGVVLAGFVVWVVVVQSARRQDAGLDDLAGTIDHMRPWLGGYLPALSVWSDVNPIGAELGLGKHIFRGLLTPLGLASGEGFDERIQITYIGNGQTSNAMTIYRVLWADFGRSGGLLASLFAGYLCSAVYRIALSRGRFWLVLLACTYCAVFFAVNYWFFAYGARVMGAVVAAMVVYWSTRIRGRVRWKR